MNPTPITMPFTTIQNLDPLNKLYIQKILKTMQGESENQQYLNEDEFRKFMFQNTPTKAYLLLIMNLVRQEFLPNKKILRCEDTKFKIKITHFMETAQRSTGKLNKWSAQLNQHLGLFNDTFPHPEPSLQLLKKLGGGYAKLKFDYLKKFKVNQKSFIADIKNRIETYQPREISPASLELISNSTGAPFQYFKDNFIDYHNRTEEFKNLLSHVSQAKDSLFKANRCFKESFKSLVKVTDDVNELKSYVSPFSMNEIPLTPLEIKFDINQLTDAQEQIILQIFRTINSKITFSPDNGFIDLSDPYFTPLLSSLQAWAPYHNIKRKDEDSTLDGDTQTLIRDIKKLTNDFNTLKYSCSPNTILATKIFKIKQTILEKYINKNDELIEIAINIKNLKERLDKRIAKDCKKSISDKAFQKVCQTHDISQEKLQKIFDEFHAKTFRFEKLREELKEEIANKNASINDLKKAYNYLIYLERERLVHSDSNYNAFIRWHYLGYYNDIDKRNLNVVDLENSTEI